MGKYVFYNNKDKLNSTLKSINKHSLSIKQLINVLTLKLSVPNSHIISSYEPYTNKNPQNRPYSTNKSTLGKIYSLPKYLINKPTVEFEKDSKVMIFSFPVVSFAPQINGDKTNIITTAVSTTLNELSLFQLNVVYKTDSGKYSISLHQNGFERGVRQPFFLGRVELGDTHNKNHQKVGHTFHIHMPFDSNIDLLYQQTILSAIYHCQPEVFSEHSAVTLNSALQIAFKKFNIKNDLDDAINLKQTQTSKFLESSCGKEWSEQLLSEKHETVSFHQIDNLLGNYQNIEPQNDIANFIESQI